MAKVFKKFRFKLFEGQGSKKYLLYAIGEVLLIVIRILVALKISNWNEGKKSNKLSADMVSEIKRGIDSDLIQLDHFTKSQMSVFESQLIISKWLGGNESYADSLSQYFSKAHISTDYSINYSGYETLKRFGLKSIKSDSIRTAISDLYEVSYPTFIKFTNIYQDFLKELLAINPRHFSELNYMQPTMRPLRPEILREDTEYAYHFNTLRNFNQLLFFQAGLLKRE